MNKETLTTLVSDLQEELVEDLPFINSGGCGIFATFMSDVLTKLRVEHKVWRITRHYDWHKCVKSKIVKAINDELPVTACSLSDYHFCVEIPDIGIFDGHDWLSKLSPRRVYCDRHVCHLKCTHTLAELQFMLDHGSDRHWSAYFSQSVLDALLKDYGEDVGDYFTTARPLAEEVLRDAWSRVLNNRRISFELFNI